jgi:uncharacterized membrane protein
LTGRVKPVVGGISRQFYAQNRIYCGIMLPHQIVKTFHVKNIMIAAALSGLFSCSSPPGNGQAGDSIPLLKSDSTTVPQQGANTVPPQLQEGADSSFLGKKRAEGIDFYAIGQEPGWALNMDMEKIYSFSTMDGIVMNTPPVQGTTSADGRITTYKAQVEMGEIMITVAREECMDIMSGEKFPFKVSVSMKRGGDKDFRLYSGCGRFLK